MNGEAARALLRFLIPGLREYAAFTALISAEPVRTQWWTDAESEHEPDTFYLVVYAHDDQGLLVPAAWAGYRVETRYDAGRVLKCCNNYVRRGFRDRNPDLYAQAYAARHAHVVARFALPAETYLFPEPIGLHLADGWTEDTSPEGSGVSRPHEGGPEHRWQRLTWTPPVDRWL